MRENVTHALDGGITVSTATIDDAAAICAIQNSVIAKSNAIFEESPRTLEQVEVWLTERLDGGWPVMLAKSEDGEVLGYGTFTHFRARDGYRYTVEHSVHVDDKYRGQGIGSMLLDALIDKARREGFRVMVGAIDGGNETSLMFHSKHGFAEVGRLPGVATKGGEDLDLVLMQRKL